MDISTSFTNISCQGARKSKAQRQFYQWVLKWINDVQSINNETTNNEQQAALKPDAPILACFLQTLGFKLLAFGKQFDDESAKKSEIQSIEPGNVRISIECGSSRMKATLELNDVGCQCPNSDHIKDASFWSITGTGPRGSVDSITQKVEETGSNLLPNVSKDTAKVLRDVTNRLFEIIDAEPDINRNTEADLNTSRLENRSYERKPVYESQKPEVGFVRSRTQPEMRLRSNSFTIKDASGKRERSTNSESVENCKVSPGRPPLLRQMTWETEIETGSIDEEPRPSPPKITSSPATMPELSRSLSQLSLKHDAQNSKNIAYVAEYILNAQRNLDRALNMLAKPSISNQTTPTKDADTESVKSAPAAVISPLKPVVSRSHSLKAQPKLNYSTNDQSLLTKSIGSGNIQSSKARRSIQPVVSQSVSQRRMQIESGGSKLPDHRRSMGIPQPTYGLSSLNSPKPVTISISKPTNNGDYITPTKTPTGNNLSARTPSGIRNRTQSETQSICNSPIGGNSLSNTNARIQSMLKPPTKVSVPKSMPVNFKTPQPSRVSNIAANSKIRRNSLSRD